MPEVRTATTLRSKEAEIVRAIEGYERALTQARADLAHIRAVIAMFERVGVSSEVTPYTSLRFIFSYSEMGAVCIAALAQRAPQTTRELTASVLKAKGLDDGDKVLMSTTQMKVVQVMRRLQRQGRAVEAGRMTGSARNYLWALPESRSRND